MRNWRILTRIVPCILILLLAGQATAIPPMPTEFYGSVVIDGTPAPVGTTISAQINGVEKGTIKTVVDGFYGGPGIFDERLKASVSEDEYKPGAIEIIFLINGKEVSQRVTYEPGVSKQLDLSIGAGAPGVQHAENITSQVVNASPFSMIQSDSGSGASSDPPLSPSDHTTISYGLDQARSFTAEDGLAEIKFTKDTMLFSPEGQFLSAVGLRSRSVSDLPPVPSAKGLKYSGYAYEIVPAETYFNPKASLVFKLPPDRAYAIIQSGPVLYEYVSQTASWEPVHTTSSIYTNEITGDIYEAAIYGLFTQDTSYPQNTSIIQSTTNIPPLNQSTSYQVTENNTTISTVITPQPVITPQGLEDQASVIGTSVTNPVTPVITPLITVVPSVSEKPVVVSQSSKIPGFEFLSGLCTSLKSRVTGPVLAGIGILVLLVVINAAVYCVYRYWWQQRK